MSLELDKAAPDFTLPTDGGGTVSLAGLRGRAAIIYFYPKDDTPGCTSEACDFRDRMPDFSRINAAIIGVSKDSVRAHDRFKQKHALPFTLASDKEGGMCEAYGAWVEKSMYGRKYMGIQRMTVLIDKAGIVRGLWPKVKIRGHAEEVLAAARAL